MYEVNENIYGHRKRLDWIISNLDKSDEVLEFGCGTGVMITGPILDAGYNIISVDRDERSIEYGREVFRQNDLNPDALLCQDLRTISKTFDVIIVSEVLEHIPEEEIEDIIELLRSKLKPGGRMLVTVPNGYGWFELESFLYFKVGLGKLFGNIKEFLKKLLFYKKWKHVKQAVVKEYVVCPNISTFDESPHVQAFTISSIQKKLEGQGFKRSTATGTVLFAGPFSEKLFSGIGPIMRLNCWLGEKLSFTASGFLVCVTKPVQEEQAEAA